MMISSLSQMFLELSKFYVYNLGRIPQKNPDKKEITNSRLLLSSTEKLMSN
jgi:hypothetical protein